MIWEPSFRGGLLPFIGDNTWVSLIGFEAIVHAEWMTMPCLAGERLRLLGIDAMEPRVQSGIPTGKGLHLELKNPGGITTVM